jgi:hypothetical protein
VEAIFSLPYSEYQTIECLRSILPKSKGFGVFVPVSRQQAGIDFTIVHRDKFLRAQVKSSRHFEKSDPPAFEFLYRNFRSSYRRRRADLYFLFGLYPEFRKGVKVSDHYAHWRNLILVFSDEEMGQILKRTRESFIYFRMNPVTFSRSRSVVGTRGFEEDRDLTPYLLEKRAKWLRRQFTK